MSRTPTFRPAVRRHVLPYLLALLLPSFAKSTDLGITPIVTQDGNDVYVDFVVHDFTDIVSMQYTITWDATLMEFEAVTDYTLLALNESNFGTFSSNVALGKLSHSWIDPTVNGVTLPDCSTIYRVHFISLNGQVSPVIIAGVPTIVEVVTVYDEFLGIEQNTGCDALALVSGRVYNDANENCQQDDGEAGLPDCSIKFERDGQLQFVEANADGEYFFHCPPGDYEISAILPENILLQPCQPVFNISLDANETAELLFGSSESGGTVLAAHERKADVGLVITPNPLAAGQALNISTAVQAELQIMGISGRILRQLQQNTNGEYLPNLQSGIYFVKAIAPNGDIQVKKLVVY